MHNATRPGRGQRHAVRDTRDNPDSSFVSFSSD